MVERQWGTHRRDLMEVAGAEGERQPRPKWAVKVGGVGLEGERQWQRNRHRMGAVAGKQTLEEGLAQGRTSHREGALM